MPRIDIAPTKSNLRKVKADLAFANEGFDLLDQKREILVMEIIRNVNKIRGVEENFKQVLKELYDTYKLAAVEMGSDALALKSGSEKKRYSITTEYQKLMGMEMPEIGISVKESVVSSSFFETSSHFDRVKQKSKELLELLARYTTIYKTIFMLSNELKKVQRRVNALEKIFIPQYEETKKFISDRLEEMEREEIFVKKMIRQGMEQG
ncbi:MAG: V-type ATP synthase subunit D [bacterium]|nr:V-type ATP synthase subunit D [bacterium]